MKDLDEGTLIEGLKRRDEASVAALLDQHWASAYRVAYGITGAAASAEDVAHEGLVRAVQEIERFEQGAALRPWLLRIVANLARNHLRGEGRRALREQAVARPERDGALDPAARAELADEIRGVQALLAALPDPLRETLSLRYLDELTLDEVAGVLGCPAGTVASRIRRGLSRLREAAEAATNLPAPLTGVGALGLLTILRGALAPPAAAAGEVLASAGTLPPVAGLLAAPESLAAGAAGGALAGGAPPPPAPNELLDAVRDAGQGLVESAPQGAASLAPLAIVLVALALGGGAAGLLLDPTPTPSLASAAAPSPSGASGAPSRSQAPGLASLPELRSRLQAPATLHLGDRVSAVLTVTWDAERAPAYLAEDLQLEAAPVFADGCLEVEVDGRPQLGAGTASFAVELRGRAPGKTAFLVRVRRSGRFVHQSSEELLVTAERPVRLVQNVRLAGPEARARATLDPRAAQLLAPPAGAARSLTLRLVPSVQAEAALSLDGFAHTPTGCFEQTTAATFPSGLVLELGAKLGGSREVLSQARGFAEQGVERIARFERPRGFALHPGEPADPWLTALGLAQLSRLARVVAVEEERLSRAARALVAWQQPDGAFPIGAYVQRRAPGGKRAVTASACEALATYLQLPQHAQDEAARAALERGLDRLAADAEQLTTNMERAYAARAFVVGGRAEAARELFLAPLLAKVRLSDDQREASWAGEWSLTGAPVEVAAVEATALAVSVLVGLQEPALVGPALTWLASQRKRTGFGGTQATILALEAFLAGSGGPARGVLQARVGADVIAEVSVDRALATQTLGDDPSAQDAIFVRALREGLTLEYRGEGLLDVQLVSAGEVPWSTPWGREGTLRAQGAEVLEVVVDRPLEGHVGIAQTWTIRARNRGTEAIASPMVELALPPGFEVPDAGRADLEALVERRGLRAWELRGGQVLVLYLPDLLPGVKAAFPFRLTPTLEGAFNGGTLQSYPYYQAAGRLQEQRLARTRIQGPILLARHRRAPSLAPAASRPRGTKAAAPSEGSEETDPTPSPAAVSGGLPPLTIAWDVSSLGKLDVQDLDLTWGAGPGERLLARALCAFPGDAASWEQTPGATPQVLLGPAASWEDGPPVVLEDYLAAFSDAREPGELPLLAPVSLAALSGRLRPQAGAGRALTWALPREYTALLESAPYAARRPKRGVGKRALAGRYRVRRQGKRIQLVPRTPGRALEVVLRKRVTQADAAAYDLLYAPLVALEDDALGTPRSRRALSSRNVRDFFLVVVPPRPEAGFRAVEVDVSGLGLPADLAGRPLAARARSVQLVLPGRVELVVAQGALRDVAKALFKGLKRAGLQVDLVTRAGTEHAIELLATPALPEPAEGEPDPREQVLGRYASLLLPGRLDLGGALDHNGFVIHPVPTSVPRGERSPPRVRER